MDRLVIGAVSQTHVHDSTTFVPKHAYIAPYYMHTALY